MIVDARFLGSLRPLVRLGTFRSGPVRLCGDATRYDDLKRLVDSQAALDYYYGQGYKRTYVAVVEKSDASKRTVNNWSRIYAWRERIDQMDMGQIQILKLSLNLEASNTNERLLRLAQVAKAWTMKCLAEEKQRPTVRELVSLMKARLANVHSFP